MSGSEDIKEKIRVFSIYGLMCLLIIFGCLILKVSGVETIIDQVLLLGVGFILVGNLIIYEY